MTKWKVVRIEESLYNEIIKNASGYKETFNDALKKTLRNVTR